MTNTGALRMGLVGCGAISTQHFEAIDSLGATELVGVVSASADRARAAGERWAVPWSTDLDDLLKRDDVDAVAICTPSGLHPFQALDALRHGKHVLIEKPIALSVADADAVVSEGRRQGRHVATVSQRRFEPAVRALHDVVAQGALGRISLLIAEGLYHRPQSYYDSAAWRGTIAQDGGVLMNQAIHLVDLVRWMGGPVVSVAGHIATIGHAMEAEDTASASLQFASGALGSIVATTCANPEAPGELRIYGDAGHVRMSGDVAQEWNVPGWPEPTPPADEASPGVGGSATWGTSATGYLRQYADFAEAVRDERPPAVTGEDGRNAVEVIAAVYESHRQARTVRLEGDTP